MKELLLIRHAKSSWADPGLGDKQRPLNERGKRDGPFMSEFVRNKGLNISHIYSSPAKRAHKTAKYFSKAFGKLDISIETDLYFGTEEEWIYLINNLQHDKDFPAFFSHNPTITYFANKFKGDFIENVPTCGIIHLRSSADTWKELDYDNTEVVNTFFPKIVRSFT